MFETIVVILVILAIGAVMVYAVRQKPEPVFEDKQYPRQEELDDFFWDEDYNRRNENL